MFQPTKPFNDRITRFPQEPSLRIGRRVPQDCVNLAYYCNPTATDAEKILTAEAPRNTIDHRVEEAWRYLFNQASDDDDLFPGFVWYEDEEGYQGRLGRMYVNWYPEAHIETKNVKEIKEIIVTDKAELPKMFEYSDAADYHGNLYLDAADFEVTKTKDMTTHEILDREVFNFELSYNVITGRYLQPGNVDAWMEAPTPISSTKWPRSITVTLTKLEAIGGTSVITDYVSRLPNTFDEGYGSLTFKRLEYQQVKGSRDATNGTKNTISMANLVIKSSTYHWNYSGAADAVDQGVIDNLIAFRNQKESEAKNTLKPSFSAEYNARTDKYDYSEINDFMALQSSANNAGHNCFRELREAMEANKDIVIYMDRIDMVVKDKNDINSDFWFEAKYKCKVSNRGEPGDYQYNVIAVYEGVLKKDVVHIKEVAAEYKATAHYVGIARKVWYDYDGMAYYRGAVTKGNGVGNINPEGDNEILMFSDFNGYLRRPVWTTKETGERELKNFYRVESDHIYLTDVFKDGLACFYKYPLKRPIYDYRGPDDRGFYEGDAVKMFTAALKDLPKGYVHNMKLTAAETELVDKITDDFALTKEERVMRYHADLYCSFISNATDTYRVTYNAFDDNDKDNVALDNGVTENVYNYPFMHKGTDFFLETVDKKARVNKIKLKEPVYFEDSRHYISFKYTITAERKSDNKKITSEERTASILNKDYALKIEYDKFDDRAMIISPESDGIKQSPFDIILYDQAARRDETVITLKDKDFVFYATITECDTRGAVNIRCNPDGSGIITAETTVDTGFWNEKTGEYTKKLSMDSPYWIEEGFIFPGYKVKCVDTRYITVKAPREEGLLQSWYPLLQFGHYSQILDQYGTHTKVCYTMPEYDLQHFSDKYKAPYVDVTEEQVEILNPHMVKTLCSPLLIKEGETTVALYKRLDKELFPIKITDISYSDGIIFTKDAISENDDIVCNYTYDEQFYVYRGFWRNENDFARIDLNPNIYHTYSDMTYTPSEVKQSKNLFNKVIYFFLKPTVEYEVKCDNDSLIFNLEDETEIGKVITENNQCLYHKIDDAQPDSAKDIQIGSVFIRQNTSLHSTEIVDSRTRGGGVLESMKDSLRHELEPESDFYLDIGYYDGEPYQENGVIIVRLDNSILKEFGGRFDQGDVEARVKRWLGLGVYPIIEYVDSYAKRDMPQYNLQVEDSYVNVVDIIPEIYLVCVDKI